MSDGTGEAVGYALNAHEDRGILFVSPGEPIYEGMIIGENAKPDDLEVNPMKSKQLTNFRASGKDDAIRLTPPKSMALEQAIAYIDDDEMVEVTPKSIRRSSEVHTSELQALMRISYDALRLIK